jgi:hypothetical protein
MGGRGIGNNIESYFINPLARVLFEIQAKPDSSWQVEAVDIRDEMCELTLKPLV